MPKNANRCCCCCGQRDSPHRSATGCCVCDRCYDHVPAPKGANLAVEQATVDAMRRRVEHHGVAAVAAWLMREHFGISTSPISTSGQLGRRLDDTQEKTRFDSSDVDAFAGGQPSGDR
jgi:hypothetical protein